MSSVDILNNRMTHIQGRMEQDYATYLFVTENWKFTNTGIVEF